MQPAAWLNGEHGNGWPGLDSLRLRDRVALVRVDYNIPPINGLDIPDDYRIAASLPTLRHLTQEGARVVLLTHRGRPGGQVMPELSTLPFARHLEEVLQQPVDHVPDSVGRGVEQAIAELPAGQMLMLENTRFHLGEQMNQQEYVRRLARLGDVFVNEAFPALHRAHASLSGLAASAQDSVVGLRVQMELAWMRDIGTEADGRFCLMIGGQQLAPALTLMRKMLDRCDSMLVGGVVANSFMAARDMGIGVSRYDSALLEDIRDFMAEAGIRGCRVLLPADLYVQNRDKAPPVACMAGRVPSHAWVTDIGPQTQAAWRECLQNAGRVLWVDEISQDGNLAAPSDLALAQTLIERKMFSIVAGEKLGPLLHKAGLREQLARFSTGSAVWMAALAGQSLPALQILRARLSGWADERRGQPG